MAAIAADLLDRLVQFGRKHEFEDGSHKAGNLQRWRQERKGRGKKTALGSSDSGTFS